MSSFCLKIIKQRIRKHYKPFKHRKLFGHVVRADKQKILIKKTIKQHQWSKTRLYEIQQTCAFIYCRRSKIKNIIDNNVATEISRLCIIVLVEKETNQMMIFNLIFISLSFELSDRTFFSKIKPSLYLFTVWSLLFLNCLVKYSGSSTRSTFAWTTKSCYNGTRLYLWILTSKLWKHCTILRSISR